MVKKKKVTKIKTSKKTVRKKPSIKASKKITGKKTSKKPTSKKNSKKTTTKTSNKKTLKKPVKKSTNKNSKEKSSAVNKKVTKQISSNKKTNVQQNKDIKKLQAEVVALKTKKKSNKRQLSEYNLFMRKQIKSGLTFEKAVKEWNKFKKLINKRKPTAYNQFIASQMKLGVTFTESVRLWKLAKQGKLGKGTTRTITKKSKPQVIEKIKYRTRKPKVVEKVKYKTRPAKTKPVNVKIDYSKIAQMFAVSAATIEESTKTEIISVLATDEEEIAFKIIQTYFKEIARFGVKKQLTLDEIINAYEYALSKVKQNSAEIKAVNETKKSGFGK